MSKPALEAITVQLTVSSESEMQDFAKKIANIAKIGDWIGLSGDLGVGKTIFAKGFMAALGFDGEVSSPSYALVNSYDPPASRMHVSHADLYRIDDNRDYLELGLDDALSYGVVLAEWADKYPMPLPPNRFGIEIRKISENRRDITLNIWGDGVSRWT